MLKSERVALHQRVQLRVFQCVQMEKVTPKCVRFSRLSTSCFYFIMYVDRERKY